MGVHAFIAWCYSDNAWPFDKVNAPTGLEGWYEFFNPFELGDSDEGYYLSLLNVRAQTG